MLLLTDLYKKEEYYKKAGLFFYIYSRSIEEIAIRNKLKPVSNYQEPNFLLSTKKY